MPDLRYVRNDKETSIKAMTRTIAILIFPDFQLLDAAGPLAIFEVAGRQSTPKAYRLRVLTRTAGSCALGGHLEIAYRECHCCAKKPLMFDREKDQAPAESAVRAHDGGLSGRSLRMIFDSKRRSAY
jgi:transcriptional regulator GlxA family with amidase domain